MTILRDPELYLTFLNGSEKVFSVCMEFRIVYGLSVRRITDAYPRFGSCQHFQLRWCWRWKQSYIFNIVHLGILHCTLNISVLLCAIKAQVFFEARVKSYDIRLLGFENSLNGFNSYNIFAHYKKIFLDIFW